MKPINGNDCDSCPNRFNCLTSNKQFVCPTVSGEEIDDVWIEDYGRILCVTLKGRRFKFRIETETLLKLLKTGEFGTYSKWGYNWLALKEKE